jgi:hypothetical protein
MYESGQKSPKKSSPGDADSAALNFWQKFTSLGETESIPQFPATLTNVARTSRIS